MQEFDYNKNNCERMEGIQVEISIESREDTKGWKSYETEIYIYTYDTVWRGTSREL